MGMAKCYLFHISSLKVPVLKINDFPKPIKTYFEMQMFFS
jgi:hypothetical protein